MQRLFLLVLLGLLIFSCSRRQEDARQSDLNLQVPDIKFTPPKNVVLMIGDGMGLTQISAAMYANGNFLNLEHFTITGMHKPYAFDNLITDSAAGATAFASGVKTYNGAIGVNADTVPVPTILEEASERGLATGMVVTSSITHATPAAFVAHQPQRSMHEAIALDLLQSGIDLFIGGGKMYFDKRKEDSRNLLQELTALGYQVHSFFDLDLEEVDFNSDRGLVYFTANGEPVPRAMGRDYLPHASAMALGYLSRRSEKGFFLMIEGSQIDWGGHANDFEYVISETLDFDEAIGLVLQFARNDGETLVIVTSDHETGGLAINPGSTMETMIPAFTSTKHTGSLMPVFAFGPGAELFGGIYENTALYHRIRKAYGF